MSLSYSQEPQNAVGSLSSNIVNIGTYGNIPVNYYTGIPDISIDIYELIFHDIKIPVKLSYHPGNVKVNSIPSWVGLGWSMVTGGFISRKINQTPDEQKYIYMSGYGLCYFPGCYESYNYNNFPENFSNDRILKKLATEAICLDSENFGDVEPDEFYFNFLGYNGRFYLDHDKTWRVISDSKIEVEFDENNGFINGADIRNEILDKLPMSDLQLEKHCKARLFNKFTLVTPDGFRYEFGGKYATEYSQGFFSQNNDFPLAMTWLLTQITSPQGEKVTFHYEPGFLQPKLSKYFYWDNGGVQTLVSDRITGDITYPMYLKKIGFEQGEILFERSISQELSYIPDDLWDEHAHRTAIYGDVMICPLYCWDQDPSLMLNNEKLDSILINYNHERIGSYKFSYTNNSDERLKLLSLEEYGMDKDVNKRYQFSYNDTKLPNPHSAQIDHWGYYNGCTSCNWTFINSINFLYNYYFMREPDKTETYIKAELLEEICYPTGGYIVFDWESNQYRKKVNSNRELETLMSNSIGGGVRIKSIKKYTSNRDIVGQKNYFYVSGYMSDTNLSESNSSGILGGSFQYFWKDFKCIGTQEYHTYRLPCFFGISSNPCGIIEKEYSRTVFSSCNLLPTGFGKINTMVGYSEVIECELNKGYTKYTFTNFDEDIYGNTHMDELPINSTNLELSVYCAFSSRAIERGKMTSIEVFDQNNKIVRRELLHYNKSNDDYFPVLNTNLIVMIAPVESTKEIDIFSINGTAYKEFTYSYNLDRKEIFQFDLQDQNPVPTISEYKYNDLNFLIEERTQQSNGSWLKTKYRYPKDVDNYIGPQPIDPVTQAILTMARPAGNHMLNYPIETIKYKDDKVIGATIQTYKEYPLGSKKILPYQIYNLETTIPLSLSDYSESGFSGNPYLPLEVDDKCKMQTIFDDYDFYGNPLQYHGVNDVNKSYVWGYNNSYPIISAENIDILSLKSAVYSICSDLDAFLKNTIGDLTTSTQKAEWNTFNTTLRNHASLTNVLIKTYTYNPLVGITSETDINGKTTYYEYDDFGRLKIARDHDGNILKHYEYHYKNQE